MANYSIIVTNNAPGCDNEIAQQISVSAGCSSYLVRLTPTSTAIGPFNVYIDTTGSTPVYSAQTRTEMLNGVVVTYYSGRHSIVALCTAMVETIALAKLVV